MIKYLLLFVIITGSLITGFHWGKYTAEKPVEITVLREYRIYDERP